jgi:hypothetical protein
LHMFVCFFLSFFVSLFVCLFVCLWVDTFKGLNSWTKYITLFIEHKQVKAEGLIQT